MEALNVDDEGDSSVGGLPDLYDEDWGFVVTYFVATLLMNGVLMLLMIWLFNSRWRVSQ